MKKYLLISLLALVVGCVPKQKILPQNTFILEDGQRPWVIAHGGAKDLFPENTMLAFRGASQIGVDALEMDLCMTSDEQIVCHHDLTINRTSDGEGNLIDYTFAELQAFNFGADFDNPDGESPYKDSMVQIPLLREVIESFPGVPLVIELKNRGENGKRAAEVLTSLLDKYDLADRVIVASFSKEVLDHFQEFSDNKYMVSASEEETEDFVFSGLSGVSFLYRPKSVAVQIPMSQAGINLSTSRVINSAHSRNMAVHYWTIDDPDDMKLLIQNGADGLITDRPDIMWEVLEELGFER